MLLLLLLPLLLLVFRVLWSRLQHHITHSVLQLRLQMLF
jgi:hypothetical protein